MLINAAGVFGPIRTVAESDPLRRWCETVLINTVGPYLLCRAFLADMLRAAGGGSFNSALPPACTCPGRWTRLRHEQVALNQFTRHLAAELAGTQITACVLHPGEVQTAMWAAIRDESPSSGEQGAGYRRWVEQVAASGGDPPKGAGAGVGHHRPARHSDNGKFLWIEDGMRPPNPKLVTIRSP